MRVAEPEGRLYYKLHPALLCYVNQQLHVVDAPADTPEAFAALDPEERLQVRDALSSRLDLIDSFVRANPYGFSEEELAIVRSWKHQVAGTFFILRYLKKYAV